MKDGKTLAYYQSLSKNIIFKSPILVPNVRIKLILNSMKQKTLGMFTLTELKISITHNGFIDRQ